MRISKIHIRKALWIGPLLVALLVIGCTGIEPYEPRDNREEGPERGVFTGSEGEFVIFRKADEPETHGDNGKGFDKPADEEEKKTKIKSGEQKQ
jgi:hypothetical protein